MPEAIAGSEEIPREEFPAPAFEADDDEVVVETTPAVPMPLIPMPAPAPAADLLPIIQPAVAVDSADTESVQQVNFQEPDFAVAECFRGHCPVGIEKHELIQANEEIHTEHAGIRYFFASEAAQEEFKLNPEKFAPVLGGDCIVTFARTGDRITGNFVANHEGQQYWFVDEQARTDFKTDPAACLARVEWHQKFLDRYSR
jgi:YHS domain-containing protein